MEDKSRLDKLVMVKRLPRDEFEEQARRLVLPAELRRSLSRYGQLLVRLQRHVENDSPLNGLLVFKGPPGSGKTMTSHAFGQVMAKAYQDQFGKRTDFFELRVSNVFSDMLGKTSQAIAEAFEMMKFSAERRPVILLADELESLAYSRGRLSAGDPSDCVRALNELLTQLDQLRDCVNFLCIGTTNLDSLLDPALVDRADYVVHFGSPSVEAGKQILLQGAQEARRIGIRVSKKDLEQAAETLCGEGDTKGASGRLLAKLVLLAYLESNSACPTAAEMINVARKRLDRQEDIRWLY